jgi:hypothetical protein
MKLSISLLALFVCCISTNALGQQAKIEGNVFNSSGRPVSRVRVIAPAGQPSTTDSKGHFVINFPDSILPGQATRIQVANWKVFDPMFGECWTQSIARSRSLLKVTIVAAGSTVAHFRRERLGAIVEEFQKQGERQAKSIDLLRDRVDELEFQSEKFAFLKKYEEEYGVPLDELKATLDEWAQTKKSDDILEHAYQEYWLGNFEMVNVLLKNIKLSSIAEAKAAKSEYLKRSRTTIDVNRLDGNAFYRQSRLGELLDALASEDRDKMLKALKEVQTRFKPTMLPTGQPATMPS